MPGLRRRIQRSPRPPFPRPAQRLPRLRAEGLAGLAPEGNPRIPGPELAEGQRAIERTAAALRAGNIVAVKGLGGFHLVCDATSSEAIALLRERKCRPHKSLAIMVPDLETARRVACVSDAEAAVLASSERPIVVLASRGVLPPAIAPDVGSIGVMLPTPRCTTCSSKHSPRFLRSRPSS